MFLLCASIRLLITNIDAIRFPTSDVLFSIFFHTHDRLPRKTITIMLTVDTINSGPTDGPVLSVYSTTAKRLSAVITARVNSRCLSFVRLLCPTNIFPLWLQPTCKSSAFLPGRDAKSTVKITRHLPPREGRSLRTDVPGPRLEISTSKRPLVWNTRFCS